MHGDGDLRGSQDDRKTWDAHCLLAPLQPLIAQSTDRSPARLRAFVGSEGARETGDRDEQRQQRDSKASRTSESADPGGSAGPLAKASTAQTRLCWHPELAWALLGVCAQAAATLTHLMRARHTFHHLRDSHLVPSGSPTPCRPVLKSPSWPNALTW